AACGLFADVQLYFSLRVFIMKCLRVCIDRDELNIFDSRISHADDRRTASAPHANNFNLCECLYGWCYGLWHAVSLLGVSNCTLSVYARRLYASRIYPVSVRCSCINSLQI